MKKQIGIFLAGLVVIVPFAITVYVIVLAAIWLDDVGKVVLHKYLPGLDGIWGIGAVLVLAAVYLIGLMTRMWGLRGIFKLLDRWVSRVPGVKTIYESTRDLLQLFGPESRRMGKAVIYRHPGSDLTLLGVMTNEVPIGVPQAPKHLVAMYVPLGAQLGGLMIYVPPENLEDANVAVEEVLKVSAIAQVGAKLVAGPGTHLIQPPPRDAAND